MELNIKKMFSKLFISLSLLTSATAFVSSSNTKPITKFNFVGDTKPFGFFDPLHIVDNKSESFVKYLREAELQHSRLAMTSMVALPLIDYFQDDKLAINYVSEMPLVLQYALLLSFGYLESLRLMKNYQNPKDRSFYFTLKDDVEPGDYVNSSHSDDIMNKELNNGRLAMIASLGYIVQELITKQQIF